MRSGLRAGIIASAVLVVGSMAGMAAGLAGASTSSSLSAGTISLIAGSTTGAASGRGRGRPGTVAAVGATLDDPSDVAVSPDGQTVYVADMTNCAVRQVVNGQISDFAGLGNCTNQTLDLTTNPQTSEIGRPTGVAVDSSGNVYIAVCNDYQGFGPGCLQGNILKVTTGGAISTIVSTSQIATVCSADGNTGNGTRVGRADRRRQRLLQRCRQRRRGRGQHLGSGLLRRWPAAASTTTLRMGPMGPATGSYTGDHGPATSGRPERSNRSLCRRIGEHLHRRLGQPCASGRCRAESSPRSPVPRGS